MSENKDDIEQILSEYKAQRDSKERREIEPLEPPKKREELIDFSKPNSEENEEKKEKKPKKSAEEIEAQKAKRKERLQKVKKAVFSKKVVITVIAILLAVALFFGIRFAVSYSQTAYLNPYRSAYPDVEFPNGILEKYCDDFGKNPDTVGYIEISETKINQRITTRESQPLTENAVRYAYVTYLDTNELEGLYKNADAYNSSPKGIFYSDLCTDFNFQVVGAFYTNTKAEDDDGYIFPYNVTEKMTLESANQYLDRIKSRLLYNVEGLELTRQDTLLIISCPTDYKDGYRFVVVCKAVDSVNNELTATDNEKAHKTASEYKNSSDNPYRFSSKWYPEIIITDENGNESTVKKTIEDYMIKEKTDD